MRLTKVLREAAVGCCGAASVEPITGSVDVDAGGVSVDGMGSIAEVVALGASSESFSKCVMFRGIWLEQSDTFS